MTIVKLSEYMYERYKLLKSNDNNVLNCNYDHFIFIKDYSIRCYSIFILFLNLHTLRGYSKSDTRSANYRAGCRDKVDNFNRT